MSFYKDPEFKQLADQWRERLSEEGFDDLEDLKENLKNPDIRSLGFQDQHNVCGFFLRLDTLLYHYPDCPRFERRVLELYSAGVHIKNIVKAVKGSDKTVRRVVMRYKKLILAINRMILATDFTPK